LQLVNLTTQLEGLSTREFQDFLFRNNTWADYHICQEKERTNKVSPSPTRFLIGISTTYYKSTF